MGVPLTYQLAQNQARARANAKTTQDGANHGATTIETQDFGREAGYVIYVYNILNRSHVVQQPPEFPSFLIPACDPAKGQVAYTVLPAFVKEPYFKPGSTEMYYKNVDGRKAATSLLNPSAYPGTNWDSQLQKWDSPDQWNNNLNDLGVWWSLTKPTETEKLDEEIKIFKLRAMKTMNSLIKTAEELAATNELKLISPMMHFAMDYLGKQAPWHMTTHHMVTCPNCGDPVKDGIAYHRNSFGDKCIVDAVRYKAMIALQRSMEADTTDEPEPETPARKGKRTPS